MGHDIYGMNKAREEIAYARFSMGNHNALLLYRFLDAYQFYAGVSGSGGSSVFSLQQVEKAMKGYKNSLKLPHRRRVIVHPGIKNKSSSLSKAVWKLHRKKKV